MFTFSTTRTPCQSHQRMTFTLITTSVRLIERRLYVWSWDGELVEGREGLQLKGIRYEDVSKSDFIKILLS